VRVSLTLSDGAARGAAARLPLYVQHATSGRHSSRDPRTALSAALRARRAGLATVVEAPPTDPWSACCRHDCRKCREVKCRAADFADGYGQWLERANVCYDTEASVVVQVVDTCDCSYGEALPCMQGGAAGSCRALHGGCSSCLQRRQCHAWATDGPSVQVQRLPALLGTRLLPAHPPLLRCRALQLQMPTPTAAGAAATCHTWT